MFQNLLPKNAPELKFVPSVFNDAIRDAFSHEYIILDEDNLLNRRDVLKGNNV